MGIGATPCGALVKDIVKAKELHIEEDLSRGLQPTKASI